MKLTKKQLLGTLATGSIASTAILAVACGPIDYSKKVLLKTTWSSSGQQIKALKAVVKEYNLQRKEGDYEVVIQQVPGGYGTIAGVDSKDIKAKYMDQVADLFLDYPSESAKMVGYGKKLDLSSAVNGKLEDKFMAFNKKIQGAESGEILNVPLAKSTEMMTLNIPVISYIDSKLQTTKTPATTGTLKKIRDYQTAAATQGTPENMEWAEIKKIWGDLKPNLQPADKIDITNATFESYNELFKWANKAGEAFTGYTADRSIIGHDAPTTLTYLWANEKLKNQNKEFLFHKDKKDPQKVDYPLTDSKSPQAAALKDILTKFKGLAEHNGMIFRGGGSYTSNSLKAHKTAISIGSTAGYSYNFAASGTFKYDGVAIDRKYKITPNTNKTKYPDAIGLIQKGKYTNPVYPSTFAGTVNPYDKKLANPTSDKTLEDLLNNNKEAYLASFKTLPASLQKATPDFVYAKYKTNYFLLKDTSKLKITPSTSTLQETEAVSTEAPSKFDPNLKTQAIMSQGPGIIGVKHGGKKDSSSIAFVKWLFDTNSKMTNLAKADGQAASAALTPIEAFDKMSNYLTPIKGAFSSTTNPYKKGNKISYSTFQKVVQNQNFEAFEDPASYISSQVRKDSFDGNLKSFNDFADKTKTQTTSPTGIYKLIVDSIDSFNN